MNCWWTTVTSASRSAAGGMVPGLRRASLLDERPGQVDRIGGDAQPDRRPQQMGDRAAWCGSRCRRRARRARDWTSPPARRTNPVLQVPRNPRAFHSPTCSSSSPGGRHSTMHLVALGAVGRPAGRHQHRVGVVGVGDDRGLLLHAEPAVGHLDGADARANVAAGPHLGGRRGQQVLLLGELAGGTTAAARCDRGARGRPPGCGAWRRPWRSRRSGGRARRAPGTPPSRVAPPPPSSAGTSAASRPSALQARRWSRPGTGRAGRRRRRPGRPPPRRWPPSGRPRHRPWSSAVTLPHGHHVPHPLSSRARRSGWQAIDSNVDFFSIFSANSKSKASSRASMTLTLACEVMPAPKRSVSSVSDVHRHRQAAVVGQHLADRLVYRHLLPVLVGVHRPTTTAPATDDSWLRLTASSADALRPQPARRPDRTGGSRTILLSSGVFRYYASRVAFR